MLTLMILQWKLYIFMMKHKNDYSDLDVRILVPDSDPKNSVRDDKGMILGVKGLIDYGRLTK